MRSSSAAENQSRGSTRGRSSAGTRVSSSSQAAIAQTTIAPASASACRRPTGSVTRRRCEWRSSRTSTPTSMRSRPSSPRSSAERPDAVWCLGDTVGYGPQPSRCCALVEQLADLSLCGNHDLGALGQLPLDDFQPDAAEVARWTGTVLDAGSRRWLESLEPEALMDGAALYHASPRDAVWEYVLTPDAVVDALERAPRPIVLVGHSHVALAITRAGRRARRWARPRRHRARSRHGVAVAAQSRLRRPAARRRPSRCLAAPRPRPERGRAFTGSTTRSSRRSARWSTPAYRRASPSGSSTEAERRRSSSAGENLALAESCPRVRARPAPLRAPCRSATSPSPA